MSEIKPLQETVPLEKVKTLAETALCGELSKSDSEGQLSCESRWPIAPHYCGNVERKIASLTTDILLVKTW